MRKRSLILRLSCLAIAVATQAATITSFTAGTAGNSTFAVGQSFTTPGGGPWDSITFNYFSSGSTPQPRGHYISSRRFMPVPWRL